MRIGINAALQSTRDGYRQTGVSRYISEVIDGLRRRVSGDRIILLGQSLFGLQESPLFRIVWEQTGLPIVLAVRRIDVFHGPNFTVPLLTRVPCVVTVHDLAFLKFPDQLPTTRRIWLIAATRMSVRKAKCVIVVSRNTSDDLVSWLHLSPDKIRVIPLAPSPRIKRVSGTSLDVFRMKWGIERPYVLAVGTLEPRKNLVTLLRAFSEIRDEVPHELVLVGPEGWMNEEFTSTIEHLKLGDRVRLTGFVSDEELGGWYSAAELFAFPSLYEGFGLPTVEAMTCGAPVLASNSSCFPDVVGDAGELLPPTDVTAWAAAMRRLLGDDARRHELRQRGFARAKAFSWDASAEATHKVYEDLAR